MRVDRNAEKQTWRVIILTTVMMGIEIAAGYGFGSMALLADGWHMGTHAAALGITIFAYWYARKHRDNPTFEVTDLHPVSPASMLKAEELAHDGSLGFLPT